MPTKSSEIDICNMALAAINQPLISSLGEADERARKCKLFYDPCRRAALRACDWTFARSVQKLALIGKASDELPDWACAQPVDDADCQPNLKDNVFPEWEYLYAYPSKCLFIHRVYSPHTPGIPDPYRRSPDVRERPDATRYEIVRSPVSNQIAIASNLRKALVRFTLDITDTSQFDDVFVQALALFVARKIALPLGANLDIRQTVDNELEEMMTDARRLNYTEYPERTPKTSSYVRARG